MRFISEHIAVIDSTKEVGFVRSHPASDEDPIDVEKWFEVDDLEAFIAAFFDEVRSISASLNIGSFDIEKTAFNKTISSYISSPSTIEDLKKNVEFQLSNVQGWLSANDYQCALIKAKCLVDALQAVVAAEESEQIDINSKISNGKE